MILSTYPLGNVLSNLAHICILCAGHPEKARSSFIPSIYRVFFWLVGPKNDYVSHHIVNHIKKVPSVRIFYGSGTIVIFRGDQSKRPPCTSCSPIHLFQQLILCTCALQLAGWMMLQVKVKVKSIVPLAISSNFLTQRFSSHQSNQQSWRTLWKLEGSAKKK